MKITHILSASVLAGIVLLSGTGCSIAGTGGNVPDPTPIVATEGASTEDTTSETEETSTEDTTSEGAYSSDENVEAIAITLNSYYYFIAQPEAKADIKEAAVAAGGDFQKFAEDFQEGTQYFDTSTNESIDNAYQAMTVGSSIGQKMPGVYIQVLEEGITVDGDTATFNTTYLDVSDHGNEFAVRPNDQPEPDDLVNLIKTADGNWVIVAKDTPTRTSAP